MQDLKLHSNPARLTGVLKRHLGTWLKVRKGLSTSYATIGYLMNGDKVGI